MPTRCNVASCIGPADVEKAKRVDLAIVSNNHRTLVSAKWSIRADREEQFQSDFETYARLESAGRDFAYTLVTNEFDAARLKAACERRRQNALLFTHVVHINPAAVLATYGETDRGSKVIDLLMRVTTVSVRTIAIVESMRKLGH